MKIVNYNKLSTKKCYQVNTSQNKQENKLVALDKLHL